MARLRIHHALILFPLLALALVAPAFAQTASTAPASVLHDRPVLVFEPGVHASAIIRADVDARGRYAVTGSADKTVRVWRVDDGRLLRTIRLPAGPGDNGTVYAVAISPEGDLVAAGVWFDRTDENAIFLFDRSAGEVVRRISGHPTGVAHLVFSPDGRYLAATLFYGFGLRVYARDAGWTEAARDSNYGDDSNWAAFADDGRLVTTSYDGRIRLYDRAFELIASAESVGGEWPFGVAFSPDGNKLAVGHLDSATVNLLDGRTLAASPGPVDTDVDASALFAVAWSPDGKTLYAGGKDSHGRIMAWPDMGVGTRHEIPTGSNSTLMGLMTLEDGTLLVAAQDPYLAVLDDAGHEQWAHRPRQADFRGQYDSLRISADGRTVDFGYELWGEAPARFDVAARALILDSPDDGSTKPPRHDGLPIDGWQNTLSPTLGGKPLPLTPPTEASQSLAIHPTADRFVLGADWSLRAYQAIGEPVWARHAPGNVWAVNISGDGRLVVAAYGDGTIRWHRMDDGKELLAFFPLADRTNWVAWTPDGFYAATPGAHGVLRWHVNRGWDAPAEAIPVSDIAELRRPEVLPLILQEMEIVQALGLAELEKARRAVQVRTNSAVKPGAQLHVLAIGISDYNQEWAQHLRLNFADKDAYDVASALLNSQGSLYAEVNLQVLRDGEATREGIFRALATMQEQMRPEADDVAVIHFSGHGALVRDALYLLPHEVDARDEIGIRTSAIGIADLRAELHRLAERGRVLILLDACRSGAATLRGEEVTVDAALLRTALATTNVTVLTSSSGSEPSREDPLWSNGAFTKVFLDALARADTDRNGVISTVELTGYLARHVPLLTEGKQTPGIEMRFERSIFATGL